MAPKYHDLLTGSLTQDWTNTSLISTSDDWSGVPSIDGFRGDELTAATGTNPQTIVADGTSILDVNANQTNPNTFNTGGVAEFEIANPVVALTGSGTADAPFLLIYLNTVGVTNINVSFNLRDVDGSIDNAVQPVALQYRIGTSGNFIDIPAGYVADASTGPSLATQVTPVNVTLPAAAQNQSQVQLRVITTNAVGNDEWIGVDDISITGTPGGGEPTTTVTLQATDANAAEAGQEPGTFRITRTGDTSAALSVNYTVATGAGQATNGTDYTPNLTGTATIGAGQSFVDLAIVPVDDSAVEGNETVTLNLVDTSDYDLGGSSAATVTIADNDVPLTRIRDIQGTAHISPLLTSATDRVAVFNVAGIVTAKASNGFYFQDPTPDANPATSEGIFVFTGTSSAGSAILNSVSIGGAVLVTGTVTEFRPAGNANNLTTTQISNTSTQALSVTPWTTAPTTTITPTIVNPPTTVINNDFSAGSPGNVETGGDFEPATEGIDYYESLEGMLVQVNNPVAVSPTNNGEIWVLDDYGADATGRTARGGSLISPNDFNPERIQIDDDLIRPGSSSPLVDVGARLDTVTGVIGYDRNNYEVLATSPITVNTPSPLEKEVTTLNPVNDKLTVATFNVENLDPKDGATQFNALAQRIVTNLQSPDIITLEEIQDNNGPTNDSVVDAAITYNTLIAAIQAAGGPTYEFRQINPTDDRDGGEPGGNIRVGFLFKPERVTYVDRPGGTATTQTTVNNVGGDPQLSFSPGRIVDTDLSDGDAFANSRKPLVGEFIFNGHKLFVIGNHFNSKGGDLPLFGPTQPPALTSEVQRRQQAQIVNNFVDSLLAADSTANVIVLGDLNDFPFSEPLNILKGTPGGVGTPILNNLIETLPANEQYTYNFQGNAQVLDHILASNTLFNNLDEFDVVHINSEFADQDSDHDPSVARFTLPQYVGTQKNDTFTGTDLNEVITGGEGADKLTGGGGSDRFVYTNIEDSGDQIEDFIIGTDKIVLTQLLDSLVPGGYNGTNAIADGYVQLVQRGGKVVLQLNQDGFGNDNKFKNYITVENVLAADLSAPNNFVF